MTAQPAHVQTQTSFVPRAWQRKALDAWHSYTGDRGRMVVAATGTGKTAFGHLVGVPYLEQGERVLWLAHRKELVEQPLKTLGKWWPQLRGGIVRRKKNQCDAPIVYASKDTIIQPGRLDQVLEHGPVKLVVVDECHHSPSPTWELLLEEIERRCPGVVFLGLTATPDREDSRPLKKRWDLVYAHPILQAIADRDLTQPYAVRIKMKEFDKSRIAVSGSDYDVRSAEAELLRAHVIEETVAALQQEHLAQRLPFRDESRVIDPRGLGALVFTVTVKQAELTAAALTAAGIPAEAVHGELGSRERELRLARFELGELSVLCSPVALTEGTDLPRAKVAVIARPSRSWSLFVQMVGRALRAFLDHEFSLLIDLVGATKEHSLIAAPVLVDGDDCDAADDGRHQFTPIEGTFEGRCLHCGLVIKCYRNLGGHLFTTRMVTREDGTQERVGEPFCRKCGAVQCSLSPDFGHHWIPWRDHKRVCVHCAIEVPDPLAALVNPTERKPEAVAWKDLGNVDSARVWAADLGRVGVLFNVVHDGGFRPYYYYDGRMVPLSASVVSKKEARLLTDDVARRANKVGGYFGGKESERKMRKAMHDAVGLARRYNLGR